MVCLSGEKYCLTHTYQILVHENLPVWRFLVAPVMYLFFLIGVVELKYIWCHLFFVSKSDSNIGICQSAFNNIKQDRNDHIGRSVFWAMTASGHHVSLTFTWLSVCLSICLSVCLSVYLSVCLSACLSVCLWMSFEQVFPDAAKTTVIPMSLHNRRLKKRTKGKQFQLPSVTTEVHYTRCK